MNKRARLNYIHALSTQVEHKKMYKAKKQWVVAGMSFLVATGLGAIGSHLTTHADTTQASQTSLANNNQQNSQKAKVNSTSVSSVASQSISAKAKSNVKAIMDYNAQHGSVQPSSVNSNSNSTQGRVPSTAPINQRKSFNSAYQNMMKQMSGTDEVVANFNNRNNKSNSIISKSKINLKDANNTQIYTDPNSAPSDVPLYSTGFSNSDLDSSGDQPYYGYNSGPQKSLDPYVIGRSGGSVLYPSQPIPNTNGWTSEPGNHGSSVIKQGGQWYGQSSYNIIANGMTVESDVGLWDFIYLPLNITPSQIQTSDQIVFNGDPNADTTIHYGYGNTYTLDAPANYVFSDGSNQTTFTANSTKHTFNVSLSNTSDQITFYYNNNQVGNTISQSGASNSTGSLDTSQLPNGYKLANGQSTQITFDGNPVRVQVVPQQISQNGKFNYINQNQSPVGNANFVATGEPNTKVDVTSQAKAKNNMPNGYGLAEPRVLASIPSNQTNSDENVPVHVNGNQVEYKGNINLHLVDANGKAIIVSGKTDNNGVISIPYNTGINNSDVIIGNPVNLLNYAHGSKTNNVSVNSANDYKNKTINGINLMNFTPENNQNNTKQNDYDIPTIEATDFKNNNIKNGNIDLYLKATPVKATVHYVLSDSIAKDKNYKGAKTFTSDVLTNNIFNTAVNSNDIVAPANYRIVGTPSLTYNNTTQPVTITPDQETITANYTDNDQGGKVYYSDNGTEKNVPTYSSTTNVPYDTYISDITNLVNIPAGYHYVNGTKSDTTNSNNNQHIDLKIAGNQQSDTAYVKQVITNGNGQQSSNIIPTTIKGFVGTGYSIDPNDSQFKPSGYNTQSSIATGVFMPNGNSVGTQSNPIVFNYSATAGSAITIKYVNQNNDVIQKDGSLSNNPDASTGTINGNTDTTGSIASEVPTPKGYSIDANQPTTYHITANQQPPIIIRVLGNSVKDFADKGIITIHLNKLVNGKSVNNGGKSDTYTVDLGKQNKHVGDSVQINPVTNMPNDYSVNGNNRNAYTVNVEPTKLSNDNITFSYDATSGSSVNVLYKSSNNPNISSGSFNGIVDKQDNIYNHVTLPKGYHFVSASDNGAKLNGNNNNITYTGSTEPQSITVTVAGNKASDMNSSKNYKVETPKNTDSQATINKDISDNAKHGYATIHVIKKSSNQLVSDYYQPINENTHSVGDKYVINPSPITNYTPEHDSLSGLINNNGALNSNNDLATFTYNANKDKEPIVVNYTNQNGNHQVYTHDIYGTYDEKGTIKLPSQISNSYDLSNKAINYQIGHTPSPLVVHVFGKTGQGIINIINANKAKNHDTGYNPVAPTAPSSDTKNIDDNTNPLDPASTGSGMNNNTDAKNAKYGTATINIVEKNTNGNIIHEHAEVIPISTAKGAQIGNPYDIKPSDISDYQPSSSSDLKGVINSDGSISNGVANFNYVVNPSSIKNVKVTYLNQRNAYILPDGDTTNDSDSASQILSNNTLATLGAPNDTVNIRPLLHIPSGYNLNNNPYNIQLQKVTKPTKANPRPLTTMNLTIQFSSKNDLANDAITNDRKIVNSDESITNGLDNNVAISGSDKSVINNDISIISSASIAIDDDIGGGIASEQNANAALDNAASAYNNAYSEYASAISSYASSEADTTANGSAQMASTNASKEASISASNSASTEASSVSNSTAISANSSATTALSNAAAKAKTQEAKLQQEINEAKAAEQQCHNNDSSSSKATQAEIKQLQGKISQLQQTLTNTKASNSANLASANASASASASNAEKVVSTADSEAESEANSKANSISASASSASASEAKNNKTQTNFNSNDVQSLASDVGNHVVVRPNITNQTVDGSALNSLSSEVANENQSIGSLANKPEASNSMNYNDFNNLINKGIKKLSKSINKEFTADIYKVTAKNKKKPTTTNKGLKPVKQHIKWIMITKPLKLHGKNGVVKTVRPNHQITLDVLAVYRTRKHYVFKVSYQHHTYLMVDNHKAFKNAYLAKGKFAGRRVKVMHQVYEFRSVDHNIVKLLHRGSTLRIRRIAKIGSFNMTRIQLTNGNWISANKNFVKVL